MINNLTSTLMAPDSTVGLLKPVNLKAAAKLYDNSSFQLLPEQDAAVISEEALKLQQSNDSISLQGFELSKKDQERVDAINKELDEIFGKPKDYLNGNERVQEKKLLESIDKILQVNNPLTEIGESDQKLLDQMFSELDALYGIKQPSEEDILRSEKLYAELDEIYQPPVNEEIGIGDFESLNEADQKRAMEILDEIDKILANPLAPDLSLDDQKQVDELNKQIDDLLGFKPLSESQEKKVSNINKSIDKIFEDGLVTEKEERTLNTLNEQLDKIFGKPKELTESELERLDKLSAKVDEIYQKQESLIPDIDYEKLDALNRELEDLYSKNSRYYIQG